MGCRPTDCASAADAGALHRTTSKSDDLARRRRSVACACWTAARSMSPCVSVSQKYHMSHTRGSPAVRKIAMLSPTAATTHDYILAPVLHAGCAASWLSQYHL